MAWLVYCQKNVSSDSAMWQRRTRHSGHGQRRAGHCYFLKKALSLIHFSNNPARIFSYLPASAAAFFPGRNQSLLRSNSRLCSRLSNCVSQFPSLREVIQVIEWCASVPGESSHLKPFCAQASLQRFGETRVRCWE